MTGYECLTRQHPTAHQIIRDEKAAWERYVNYMIGKMPIDPATGSHSSRKVHGDETSHGLFRDWRAKRDARDRIGNPRHKDNRRHAGRFSTRAR